MVLGLTQSLVSIAQIAAPPLGGLLIGGGALGLDPRAGGGARGGVRGRRPAGRERSTVLELCRSFMPRGAGSPHLIC